MANVKISELTAITSSSDLANADIVPIVDSSDSSTKRVALSVLDDFWSGGGSSVWCTGTNTAYLLTDCIGIGTATPGTDIMLRVQGDSCYTGDLKIGGDVCIGGDDLFMNTNTSGHMLIADGTNFNPVAMSGDVGIDSAGATTIQATSVENSMLAGSIANAKLSNSSVSYGGISLSLGGTDATPAFNLCDATAYKGDSSLVTVGTIASGVWNGTAIANGYLANSSITLSDGSNTTAISLGGTMTFSGTSNEIEVAESSGTVTVGLPACVTGLTTVCATNFAGTLATAAQTNVTSLGTLTALTASGNVSFDGGTFVFNESGADLDFRIEGDSDANLLIADASTDRIGIGTATPDYLLSVAGNAGFNEYIYHNGDADTYIRMRGDQFDFVAGNMTFLTLDESSGASADTVTVNHGDNDIDFLVNSDDGTQLIRTDAENNRVGIGTEAPATMLHVQGDTCVTGAVNVGGDLTISGDDLIMGTNTSGYLLVADGTNYNPVAVSGDVTISSAGAVTIAATSVENSMLAGSIANAKLSNSSVSYGGVSLSLGGTDATPAFDLCDATAYKGDSALVTVGTVASGTWQGTAVATAYIAGTICDKTLASPVLCGTITGNAFLDEDNMASDSASKVASQQSIKAYVDSVASGLDLKCSSHAATTANLSADYSNGSSGVGATLTNNSTQAAFSIDGQTMVADERVLIKDQSTGAQNGIYTVSTVGSGSTNWVLTRATDFDTSTEITSGAFTFVETGSSYADSGWVMTTDGTVTVGTTSLAWSQFSGAGQITAGDGMTKSGNTLNVGAGSNLLVNADAVAMCAIVTGLTTVCATNFAGTLATAAQTNVTSLGTLTALTVDSICLDGTTIGHTSDTDLMTVADGLLTVTGCLNVSNDVYTDSIRRYSNCSTTTKILINKEVIKINAGHASNEVVKIASGAVTIDGDLTICGDDLVMGTNTSGYLLVADGTNYNPVAVSGDIAIDSSGATTIQATSVDNSMLAGSIANDKLSNSSVSYGGISLSLGGTDATPAFNLCDATAYKGDSALVTVGTIASGTWNGTAIANGYLANSSVSYGGVSVSLGSSDATPAICLCDATAYKGDSALVTSGALNSGSITSGFGNIDNGSSTLGTGAATVSSLSVGDGNITNVGDIAVDTISGDADSNTTIGFPGSDVLTLNTGGNEAMRIDSSQQVGIGNDSPGALLEISKSAVNATQELSTWSTNAAHGSYFTLQKSASATINTLAATADDERIGIIYFNGVATYDGGSIATAGQIMVEQDAAATAGATPGRMTFHTSDSSAIAERMRIDSSGNVGIGTTTPNEAGFASGVRVLSIQGDDADDFGAIELISPNLTGANRLGELRFINMDGGADPVAQASVRAFRDGADDATAMSFYTEATGAAVGEKMRITGGGNIGIGNETPNEAGFGSGVKVLSIKGTTTDDFGVIELISPNLTAANRLGEIRFINMDGTSGQVAQAGIRAFRDGADDATAMSFFTEATGASITEKMRITSAGNIGIGTASPIDRLHIVGDDGGTGRTTHQANAQVIIENNGDAALVFSGCNTDVGVIQWDDVDAVSQGSIYYSHDTDAMVFGTADGQRMVIDCTGAVTKPTSPAFLANNSVQTLNVTGDGTVYNLCFANERFDQGGDWDGLKVFTAPVTGKYYLSLQTDAVAVNTAMCIGTITIVTSNQNYERQYNPSNPNGISYVQASLVVTADMDAGDIACVTVYIGGSTKTAGFGGNSGFGLFGGVLIA